MVFDITRLVAVAAPSTGVTKVGLVIVGVVRVGLVLNTSTPVPVSSVIAARKLALVGLFKNA